MRNHHIFPLVFGLVLVHVFDPSALAAQEIFRSNAAEMRLERIGQADRELYRYVIEVARNGESESERFFDGGELIRETRRVPGPAGTVREEQYRTGELGSVRLLDSEERPISEEFFSDGELTERREYRYRGDLLVETLVFDDRGELVRSDEFRYAPGGGLRSVRMVDGAGRTRNAYYAAIDGRLLEEYHEGVYSDIRVRYDEYGRPLDEIEYVDGARRKSTLYAYESASETVASTVREIDHARDREIVRTYAADGDILEEREYLSGAYEGGFVYIYRDELLVERQGRGASADLRELFAYDEEGELQEVKYFHAGELRRQRRHLDANEYIDSLYRDGEVVLRSFYRGDRRLREEVLQNGQVVRTREFE